MTRSDLVHFIFLVSFKLANVMYSESFHVLRDLPMKKEKKVTYMYDRRSLNACC